MRCTAGPRGCCWGMRSLSGTARGVDQEGALLLDTGHGMQRFVSGEASLRVAEVTLDAA